ncbi:ATP-binding protein [Cellulomonas rhizosphaerae]|uniref:histidine kinase n=1 Tax=Cellulomonas rhizosphaerae TaxID=2293719 RepID=A0A413RIM2_9CELL|nr:ATP-binding protein [Cellulomonas rhizosphaerae]RHA38190.1 HAMP domain-containing protein [Cellulomonas rhizosphaerae]
MGRWSLRARLTVVTAALLCVALVVGAVALTTVLSRSRIAALDDVVTPRASTVAALAADDRLPAALPVEQPGEIVQLLDASGHVLASSTSASRTLPVLPADVVADLGRRSPWVGSTSDSAYDEQARVAVRTTTWQGEPATVVATVPLGEVRSLLRALTVALLVVVPLLTALLAAAIWFALGRALTPVEQLRRAAAQVAVSGGPGSLPVPAADDELGALARTLNEMLDRLETAAARQRTFVADAAHELRSPIASLRAAVDVARAHPGSYAPDELAADLDGDLARMQALVDDLLLLARVGSASHGRSTVDLAALAASVGAVEVVGSGSAVVDADAVGRVLRNLVDNATRHASSRVLVTVAPGSVTVDDDGSGVAAADRERVFERFVRLDEAREREAGGSGLGLAIAREIARDQGGDVTLADSPLGGLRAVLTLS